MRLKNHLASIFVLICLPLAVFSQNDDSKTEGSKAGLRKIGGGRSPKIDVHIDQAKLEADIEMAVETALRSVEHSLEGLQINIEPIEIDLGNLNIDLEPLVINIPDIDIDIEPIEVELDDMDMDMDNDDWNDEGEDDDEEEDRHVDKIKAKDWVKEDKEIGKEKPAKEKAYKVKEKSDKEKAKGLKKVD